MAKTITPDQIAHAWVGFHLPEKPRVPKHLALPGRVVLWGHRDINITIEDGSAAFTVPLGVKFIRMKTLPESVQRYLDVAIPLSIEGQEIKDTLWFNSQLRLEKLFPNYDPWFNYGTRQQYSQIPIPVLMERVSLLSLVGIDEELIKLGMLWSHFIQE